MKGDLSKQQYEALIEGRAYMPHCDSSILHAPSTCQYCDNYPDFQRAREVMRINFTNTQDKDKVPCPSTWFRSREKAERWHGNRAYPVDNETSDDQD